MSQAGGDTSSSIGDGDLQFWTKTSSGSLTRRVEIKANGDIAFNNCTSTINSSNYGFYLMNDSDSTKSIYFRQINKFLSSNMDIASLSQVTDANLSIVPINNVGGLVYILSSITVTGSGFLSFENEQDLFGQT